MLLTTGDDIDAIQASLLRSLASIHRVRIIHLLGDSSLEVNELARQLGLHQAPTSQHLAVLRAAGVVEAVRDGRSMHYRLTDPQLRVACELMREVLVRRLSKLGDIAAHAGASSNLVFAASKGSQL